MAGEAEGLAQRMMKKGVQLSPLGGSAMVRELCRSKRWLDACYWLRLMDDDGVLCDSDVYASVLLGLSEEGHVLEASALARKVIDRGIQIKSPCADCLVQLLRQHCDEELASHILGLRRSPEGMSL
jgi:pentatricopeptide repeat protein